MSLQQSRPLPQVNAFVIAIEGRHVGLAVAGDGGFHFVAADPDYRLLDGSRFRRIEQVEHAARRLTRAVSQAPRRMA
jgi:hypothetical protein